MGLGWESWKHGGVEELARSERDGSCWSGGRLKWEEGGGESVRFGTSLGWDVSELFDRFEDVWKVGCSDES